MAAQRCPVAETWEQVATMHAPRCAHSATLLADGRILVAGGHSGAGGRVPLPTTELYDPTTNTWIEGDALPACRHSHRALRADDRVIVVAGVMDGNVTRTLAVYTPR